jgi:hypothetical protein
MYCQVADVDIWMDKKEIYVINWKQTEKKKIAAQFYKDKIQFTLVVLRIHEVFWVTTCDC